QALGIAPEIELTGVEAYNNSFTQESVQQFAAAMAANPADIAGAAGLLQVATIGLVKPERVQAIELGYRSVVNNDLSIDISTYYNIYNDFLSQARVITPYYGDVNTFDAGNPATYAPVSAIANGDRRVYQIYTNSKTEVTSLGFGIGLSKKVYQDFELGVNYNHAQFMFDQAEDPS